MCEMPENVIFMIKILSGDYQRVKARKQALIAEFLADNDPLAIEDIDIENNPLELGDILGLLATTSLFNPKKLVILRNLGSKSDLSTQIELILSRVIEGISLVLIERKLDKKTSFGKFLRSHPGFEEYQSYKGLELENWLIRQAAECQSQLNRQAASYLIQRTGPENSILVNEIQKLRVHPVITEELIDDLVAPSYSSQVFDFLDALMRGRADKALELYKDQRQQKNEPLSILGLFVWQLRILLIVKKNEKSIPKGISKFNINEFVLRKTQPLLQGMSMARLNALVEICYKTDKRIRHEFVNPDETMLFFIFKGCYLVKKTSPISLA